MSVPRKLAAEWNAKLRAAGFQDLEGADRDGPLSDRGNLHAVTETEDAHAELAHRLEFGAEYYRWAQGFRHAHRFRNPLERRIWAAHSDGDGLREIAKREDITYHDARDVVNRLKKHQGNQGNQGKETVSCEKFRKRHRRLSWETALQLTATFLRTLTPSSTRASAS